jgi:hypothetical protein
MTYCRLMPAFFDSNAFRLGPGFWATVPAADLLSHHLRRAWQVIADYQLPAPATHERLELIVMLAIHADMMFFTGAVFEPCKEDCDGFFTDFIRRSLQPVPLDLQ